MVVEGVMYLDSVVDRVVVVVEVTCRKDGDDDDDS